MFATSCQNSEKAGSEDSVSIPRSTSLNLSVINSGQINISWSSVGGAAYYDLYRSVNGSGGQENIYTGNANSYEDKELDAGSSYCYRLAVCDNIVCSAKSNCYYASTNDPPAAVPDVPAPPVISGVEPNQLRVSWSAAEEAVSYKLYRSTSANGLYVEVYSENGLSHQDTGLTAGTGYYYKLASCNGAGCSGKSNPVSATTGAAVGGNPSQNYWTLTKHKGFVENPSIVNIFFQATDYNGSLVDNLQTGDFILRENGVALSPRESFLYVDRKTSLDHELKTVILLDVSPSMTEADLSAMVAAAKSLVVNPDTGENVMLHNQKIAVYAFAETARLLTDFTDNVATLTDQIESALDQDLGISTNLHGAVISGLGHCSDNSEFSKLVKGALIVFTDGEDTANISSLSSVISSRGDKDIYTVAIGDAVSSLYLSQIGNAGNYRLSNFSELQNALSQVSEDIQVFISRGFYALRYASPKRSGVNTLALTVKDNDNRAANAGLSHNFNADGFGRVPAELEIIGKTLISPNEPTAYKARTLWEHNVNSEYSWEISNSNISIHVDSNDDSRVELTGTPWQGSAELTVRDTLNNRSLRKDVIIGTIHAQGVSTDGNFIVERGHNISLTGINSPQSSRSPKYSWSIADQDIIYLEVTTDSSAIFKGLVVGSTTVTIRDTANDRQREIRARVISDVTPPQVDTVMIYNTYTSIRFSEEMDSATITANTSGNSCSGSVQISGNNFSSCLQIASVSSENSRDFTFIPTSALTPGSAYQIKILNSVKDSQGNHLEDVYSASNICIDYGSRWTRATSSAPWDARYRHSSVVFDNKIWVIGGNGSGYKNDVWHSSDGINWTEATSSAPWSDRSEHSSVVFDNKIWVIGGNGPYKNDVWYSGDGINWTEATSSAPWSDRSGHSSVVFDNKIWVIGGCDRYGYKNDVWYSGDGINWTEATSSAPWSNRSGHSSVVFDNKIWVVGAYSRNDVWYSGDGINWTEATSSATWSARVYYTSVVFDNKIWVLGGLGGGSKSDVWHSSDGINWTRATSSAPWRDRFGHSGVVFDNTIWVLGGANSNSKNDVWHMERPLTLQ